ncbi:SWI/SNF chromatin remodeling complex subunit swsn-7 [Caenorhabditis elegans]|uniref:SWI/SNF chromatin remodeling complex subunit swsn-7 n=1 Tax=Caenorhabditis elegans TaxID=6239 RepID=SWSN7_CAEEL|nr:SWI/SNF nucleosome remodeling complex component [Caenorhabditis elegans]Q09441.1 RecName: Full=SWI/SNF nucleosome remodeling complex component; AltName: Full=ARID domain-containing protein C08B11.3 [Caenorhabditis elegans]CAA86663.1 SWI/SNF nucleosome remodeling complex component [Caenorhabditis elegans]|eukprot:NP_495679.1 SWI/SNF nucleosome remodeling complex component [Caenorhabditis elegans]
MESRKRKSELEHYIDKLTDPPEKQRKMAEFYNSLRMFYKRRWNATLKLPHVQGVEVNLYRLYDTVMALGGWQKVAASDKWSDIAEMFGCKDDILCGDHAIKIIYMRYLSKFEQVETIGDVDDYVDNEMSRSRGRNATSFFATNECPISNNRMVQEYQHRDERGQIINEPDYARLTKSLISGLPNEIDFAMNVCMLLSHAGPKQLRICHAPTLLTLLVAHTGVYDEDDETMADMGKEWKRTTKHNFRDFWASSGVPLDMLMTFLDREIEAEYIDEDDQFFTGVSETFNVKDSRCWRLNQVTTIIRNLSFEPANRVTIVKTWPVMKFLIMCASCKWSPLYVAALDALSNLATDIDLTDKTLVYISQHAILRIITDGIFSLDKFKLVRSLEILTGLCGFEGNEAIICDWLNSATIAHIFEVVGVKDIMMCVYTLECLYQISEMGDTACDLISESPKAIQQLVSMATLEAVSFGPAGLAGMKVVEYQPSFTQGSNQQQNPHHSQGGHQLGHSNVRMGGLNHNQHHQQIGPPGAPGAAPMTVRQVIQNNLALQQVQRENLNREQYSTQSSQPHPPHTNVPPSPSILAHHSSGLVQQNGMKFDRRTGNLPVRPIAPSTNSGESQLEQLTEKWIRQNCVFEPAMSTPRGELYAAYVDDLRNLYHSMSGSLAMFSGVMKNLYPDVNFRMAQNGIMIVAQGIRLIRPHRLAPAASQSASESHPLMKKMLTSEPKEENGVLINGHAVQESGAERIIKTEPIRTDEPSVLIESQEQSVPKKQNDINGEETDEVELNSKIVTPEKKSITNGTVEVCQEPIQASKLFDENYANQIEGSEVSIEIREQFVNDTDNVKLESEKINGIICNGNSKVKKESMASRAAHIVAVAAACNGDLERMNVVSNGNDIEKEIEKETEKVEEETNEEKNKEVVETEVVDDAQESEKRKCVPPSSNPTDYMCDWDCCSIYYASPSHVLKHLSEEHVAEELRLLCRWNGCADPTPRNRWSLITHIQDSHCNEAQLKAASQKRKEGGGIAPVRGAPRAEVISRDINNHPGYAKNAAFDAIRRHAFNFLSRELTDEAEGPVTKSIRLTSCLILRNLARYSAEGRQKLRRHESHICWLALSRLESAHALSQLLSELHQAPAAEEEQQKMLSEVPSSASLSSMAGSSSQLPTVPDSPTSSVASAPMKESTSVSNKPTVHINRMLNFSSLNEKTPTSPQFTAGSSPHRHQPIQQHIPSQPSPLVQTTPVRAGAGI